MTDAVLHHPAKPFFEIIIMMFIFFETSNLYTFSTRQCRQGLSRGEQGEANPGNQDIADCH